MRLLSVVIPLKDEQDNIEMLCTRLRASLAPIPAWEAILVDDGSRDGTFRELERQAAVDARLKVVRLRQNYGQSAALQAGIDASKGDIVATMDGDLQNDPQDLPRLLAKLDEGYDVVLGERAKRQDGLLLRKIPSWWGNFVIRQVTGVRFRDFGCTIRVMRREFATGLNLYGEMHRFISVIAAKLGARITQIPVGHHARVAGRSKYTLSRTFRVILDLFTVQFLHGYLTRPMHFLGGTGLVLFLASLLTLGVTGYMKLQHAVDMTGNPLLLLSVLLFLVGMQFLSLGLLGEVLARTYFESQGRKPYTIRESRNLDASIDRQAA